MDKVVDDKFLFNLVNLIEDVEARRTDSSHCGAFCNTSMMTKMLQYTGDNFYFEDDSNSILSEFYNDTKQYTLHSYETCRNYKIIVLNSLGSFGGALNDDLIVIT